MKISQIFYEILKSYCEYQDLKMARQIKKRSRHGGIRKKKSRNSCKQNISNESDEIECPRNSFPTVPKTKS